jgi:hypothetical protein
MDQVGVNQRTASDRDRGVKKSSNALAYLDGLRVDYAAWTCHYEWRHDRRRVAVLRR